MDPEKPVCSLGQSSPLLQLGGAGAVLCHPLCTSWGSQEGAGRRASASPLAALSALSNARLTFFFFFFPLPSFVFTFLRSGPT